MVSKQIYKIAAPLLLTVGLGLVIFSLYPQAKKNLPPASPVPSASPVSSPSATPLGTWVPSSLPSPTITNSSVPSPAANNSPTPSPSPAPQQNQVNLVINGGAGLSVNINSGDNQCNVLTRALEQGKIQSLNMRFNDSLGSDAVYQINGIGKENSVWWTYKVNGQSPSQGCSYIKANNNDSIEWQYIGS